MPETENKNGRIRGGGTVTGSENTNRQVKTSEEVTADDGASRETETKSGNSLSRITELSSGDSARTELNGLSDKSVISAEALNDKRTSPL